MRQITTLAATFFVLSSPVFGHHADTGLDLESVLAIEGTVTEFNWRNPHTYLSIESTDADSQPVEWEIQFGRGGRSWSTRSNARLFTARRPDLGRATPRNRRAALWLGGLDRNGRH